MSSRPFWHIAMAAWRVPGCRLVYMCVACTTGGRLQYSAIGQTSQSTP